MTNKTEAEGSEAARLAGMDELYDKARQIAAELFGPSASAKPLLETVKGRDVLVLQVSIPRELRHLRHEFLNRYVTDTAVPEGSTAPVLMWEYADSEPTPGPHQKSAGQTGAPAA